MDPSKVEVSRDHNHLYLAFKDTGEKLTLQHWYNSASYQMSAIRFADGTTWTAEDASRLALTIRAPEGGGSVSGYGTDDTLIGSDKADSLYGNGGNDILNGNKGDDYLYGGAGDDTLIGGTGNDYLEIGRAHV